MLPIENWKSMGIFRVVTIVCEQTGMQCMLGETDFQENIFFSLNFFQHFPNFFLLFMFIFLWKFWLNFSSIILTNYKKLKSLLLKKKKVFKEKKIALNWKKSK